MESTKRFTRTNRSHKEIKRDLYAVAESRNTPTYRPAMDVRNDKPTQNKPR